MTITGAICAKRSTAAAFPNGNSALQLFDQKFADCLPYDVLDPTKIIPEEVMPLRIVGRMVLDRNPDNFFAETEQVAFCPANIVPGIDFSNDPLLQGRLFSYLDTQKSRLGTANFHQLPINAPKCPFMNFQRDGQMQMNGSQGPRQLRTQQPGGTRRRAGGRANVRSPVFNPLPAAQSSTRKATSSASGPSYLPTTIARHGCSGNRSSLPSKHILRRRSSSNCQRSS